MCVAPQATSCGPHIDFRERLRVMNNRQTHRCMPHCVILVHPLPLPTAFEPNQESELRLLSAHAASVLLHNGAPGSWRTPVVISSSLLFFAKVKPRVRYKWATTSPGYSAQPWSTGAQRRSSSRKGLMTRPPAGLFRFEPPILSLITGWSQNREAKRQVELPPPAGLQIPAPPTQSRGRGARPEVASIHTVSPHF